MADMRKFKESNGCGQDRRLTESAGPASVAFRPGAKCARLAPLEPFAGLLRVALPLLRHVVFKEYGGHWADMLAGRAIDARVGVDVVLLVIVRRMYAVDGADVNAGGVLHPAARLSDDVGHALRVSSAERFGHFSKRQVGDATRRIYVSAPPPKGGVIVSLLMPQPSGWGGYANTTRE